MAGRDEMDNDRRQMLKAMGIGSAVLLMPRVASAEEPPASLPEGGKDDDHPIVMATTFATQKGTSDRVRKRGEALPEQDTNGARVALDVHRNSSGNVVVKWGSGATSVGSGATAMTVVRGANPARATTTGGKTVFKLTFNVEIASDGSVSVVTPGTDPS